MNFKEFLVEMATKLVDFENSGRRISIHIRTGNKHQKGIQPGQSEHYPAHIHVINFKDKLDIPIEIETGKVLSDKHHIQGKLSKIEKDDIKWFIEYYGKEELKQIFDKAINGIDPSPLFDVLRKRKDNEHKNKNNQT